MAMPVGVCEICGAPRKAGRRYCSRQCAWKGQEGKPHPPELKAKISVTKRKSKGPDVTRVCRVCGVSFTCRPQDKKEFCSVKCRQAPGWRPPRSAESRARMSKKYQGAGSPSWKGGISPANQLARSSIEYSEWRRAVFVRDNFACVDCGSAGRRSNPICAHHIVAWAENVELRFEIDNGVTLCHPCHELRHGRKLPLRIAETTRKPKH
jgi:hypothetical protein